MSFEALRASVEGRLNANYSATEVAYENVSFNPPNDAWIRLIVQTGQGQTMGLYGDGTSVGVRDTGLISIQVFIPEGQGTKSSLDLVDTLIAIYEHTRFDGILAYTATVSHIGISDGWHQTNITIPFRRVRNV